MVILTWILGIAGGLTTAGGIAGFIFFPVAAAKVASAVLEFLLACKPCLVVAVFIGVAIVSFWYGRNGQYERGHTAAVAEIAAEDEKALAHAVEKRAVWEKCRADNGEWNQSTGVCK